jgi:hypothetical protein
MEITEEKGRKIRKPRLPREEKNNYREKYGVYIYLADFLSTDIPESKHKVI